MSFDWSKVACNDEPDADDETALWNWASVAQPSIDVPDAQLADESGANEAVVTEALAVFDESCVVESGSGLLSTGAALPPKRGRKKHILKELADIGSKCLSSDASGRSSLGLVAVLPEYASNASGPLAAKAKIVESLSLHVPASCLQMPAPRDGFMQPISFADCLLRALGLAEKDDAALDKDYMALSSCFLHGGSAFHMSSTITRAQQLNIYRGNFQKKLWRLMSSQWLFAKVFRLLLEQQVIHIFNPEARVLYVDYQTYDETPMRASIKGDVAVDTQEHGMVSSVVHQDAINMESSVWTHGLMCKVLQSKQKYVMLLKHSSGYLRLLADFHAPLQVLERNTADVTQEAVLRTNGASFYSKDFGLTVRASCTDEAPSNLRAEASIVQGRAGEWHMFHTHCEVHVTARILNKTFQGLVAEDFSSMLHVALSLRQAGALAVFRAALKDTISSKLKLLVGQLPVEAQSYKDACMALFFGEGSGTLLQKSLIQALPNGDWRNCCAVEYYMATGQEMTHADVCELLTSGICLALLGKKPTLYAASRWTGADVATDDLMRLQCVHGLLEAAYEKFASYYSKAGVAHGQEQLEAKPASLSYPGLQEWIVSHDGCSDDVAVAAASAESWPGGAAEEKRSAEDHTTDRKIALTWLRSKPMGRMIVVRLALMPIMDMMYSQLNIASESWERQQQSLCAKFLLGGSAEAREFMITMVAKGILEKKLLSKVMALLVSQELWNIVPGNDCTAALNAKAMMLLCRQAALVEDLMACPHRGFPWKLFTLLSDPARAAELASSKRCTMDAWSQAILTKCPSLQEPDLSEILLMHCQCCATSTSETEAKHASNRRLLQQRSTQTWSLQVPTASAGWMGQSMRRSSVSKMACDGVVEEKKKPQIKKVVKKLKSKRRSSKGGAFRAFVHVHAKGKPGAANFRDLSKLYWEAKRKHDESFRKIVKLGQAATAAGALKATGSSFGPKGREAARSKAKSQREATWQRASQLCSLEKARMLARDWSQHGASFASLLSESRQLMKRKTAEEKKQMASEFKQLQDWQDKVGKDCVQRALAIVPCLKKLASAITVVPGPAGCILHLSATSLEDATRVAAWASSGNHTNLSQVLETHWLELHKTILHSKCEKTTKADKSSATACLTAGTCICSGSGKQLERLRLALHKRLKGIFNDACSKKKLDGGEIVLVFKTTDAGENGPDLVDLGATDSELWLHVAAMSWSPYRAVFSKLQGVDCPTDEHAVAGRLHLKVLPNMSHVCMQIWNSASSLLKSRDCITKPAISSNPSSLAECLLCKGKQKRTKLLLCCLEVIGQFMVEHMAMQLLEPSLIWKMEVWQLETSLRPLAKLHPDVVSIERSALCSDWVDLWPEQKQTKLHSWTRKRKRGKTKEDGGEAGSSLHSEFDKLSATTCEKETEFEEEEEEEEDDVPLEQDIEEQNVFEALLSRAEQLQGGLLGIEEDIAAKTDQELGSMEESLMFGPVDASFAEAYGSAFEEFHAEASDGLGLVPEGEAPLVCETVTGLESHAEVARGPLTSATVCVRFPKGTISFYEKGNFFEAVCGNKKHGSCKLRRSCKGRIGKDGILRAGRPLGFLCQWLHASDWETKAEHWEKAFWCWTQTQRKTKRDELRLLDGGAELLSYERDVMENEPEEAECVDAYLR
eukprot:4678090-Amphidinium_carterae.1